MKPGRGRDRQSIPGRTSTPGSPALKPQGLRPVLCSGNGQYIQAVPVPQRLEGRRSDVRPTSQCIDRPAATTAPASWAPCICNPGYKGENCEEGRTPGQVGAAGSSPARQRRQAATPGSRGSLQSRPATAHPAPSQEVTGSSH